MVMDAETGSVGAAWSVWWWWWSRCGRLWCSGHWWHVVDQLKEVVVVVMVWVVIGLSYVVDVGDVVDEVEVEVAVWGVCGHGIVLVVSREVDAVVDVGYCQEER